MFLKLLKIYIIINFYISKINWHTIPDIIINLKKKKKKIVCHETFIHTPIDG